jgi:hypothetical protein
LKSFLNKDVEFYENMMYTQYHYGVTEVQTVCQTLNRFQTCGTMEKYCVT